MERLIKSAEKLRKSAEKLLQKAEELEAKVKNKKLPAPKIGETVEIAGMKWIILDKSVSGYMALSIENVGNKKFGANNNWKESSIRKYLNDELRKKIEDEIGRNLPSFCRNLFSMDGQTEYGDCVDNVSILTIDEYRKYRKYIPNAGYSWWTCTPNTTPNNGGSGDVQYVGSCGRVVCDWYYGVVGVRPFLIFPSEIFESTDE